MDNLAHKILHTFEKMDPINPTFELIFKLAVVTRIDNLIKREVNSFGYLFGLVPFVTQVNTHLN